MSLEHMKRYLSAGSSGTRRQKAADAVTALSHALPLDPSYRDTLYIWKHGRAAEELECVPAALHREQYSDLDGITVNFDCMPDRRIHTGDIVFDSSENTYRLCTQSFIRDGIVCSGVLARCGCSLRWQDENGDILDYPCFCVNAAQYNYGMFVSGTAALGASKFICRLPADRNTLALTRGKRFFIGNNPYVPMICRVTMSDTITMYADNGIVRLILEEDELDPEKDSRELRICDYREKDSSALPIKCGGGDILRIGTAKRFFTESRDARFSVMADSDLLGRLYLDEKGGGSCDIRADSDSALVGRSFIVTASDGSRTGSKEITLTGGV